MARKLSNRFNSSLRIPSTRSSSVGASAAEGSQHPKTTADNGAWMPARLLRFPTVRERTGLSRSTIWRLERRGEFPRHRRISANVVAWVETEVIEWIQAHVKLEAG